MLSSTVQEFDDARDADDAVYDLNGKSLCGDRYVMFYLLYVKRVCIKHCLQCFHAVFWGSRKGIRPVKNWVVGCWRGYLSRARCRLAYGPADATATYCLLLQ